jgi:hypothetical protein
MFFIDFSFYVILKNHSFLLIFEFNQKSKLNVFYRFYCFGYFRPTRQTQA